MCKHFTHASTQYLLLVRLDTVAECMLVCLLRAANSRAQGLTPSESCLLLSHLIWWLTGDHGDVIDQLAGRGYRGEAEAALWPVAVLVVHDVHQAAFTRPHGGYCLEEPRLTSG